MSKRKQRIVESRRRFLQLALAGGSLFGLDTLPILGRGAGAASFPSIRKPVLVNLFLAGGPDMRHLFPPRFDASPGSYGYAYWQQRARSHRIAGATSAYQRRWDEDYYHTSDGSTRFGILKRCGWLKQMWDTGNVAIVCNTLGATSRDHRHAISVMDTGDLRAGNVTTGSGWGGRLASAAGGNCLGLTRTPRRFCYGAYRSNPTNLRKYDNHNLIAAADTRRLSLFRSTAATSASESQRHVTEALEDYYTAKRREIERDSAYFRFIDHERKLRDFGEPISERLSTVPIPSSLAALYDESSGVLTDPYIGLQIRNLYDAFASSDILDMRVASLEYNSWDSHADQVELIEGKLEDLFGTGKALHSLYRELPQDAQDNMVLVINGEFGRQLKDNGGNGTDHGRGNAVLIIGNRVNGGVYGEMFPEEELARLAERSPDIEGRTEFDHVFGAVCDWISPGSKDLVFPNHRNAMLEAGLDLSNLVV